MTGRERNETGKRAEKLVIQRLRKRIPECCQIVWTRTFKTNAPFDIIVLDCEFEPLALLEVKGFEPDRKHYWFQQKRSQIRRKLAWQKANGQSAEIFTVGVKLAKRGQSKIGYIAGLPSCPFDWTEPIDELAEQITTNARLKPKRRYWKV